ncbi:MAG: Kelch repeat-containing protein, partial [Nitriliruptorales bacterium]
GHDGGSPFAEDLAWEALPPVPTPRTEVAAAATDERIYVIGGFVEGGATTPLVEVYDVESRTWSRGPDLPVAVNHAMAAAREDDVVVAGGYLGPGLANPTNRVFRLAGDGWEEMEPMPGPRAAGGAAFVGRRLHVVAGIGEGGLAADMFVLAADAARWSAAPGPTPREHLGVAAPGGSLTAVAGRTGGMASNLAVVERYDPDARRWEALPDLPTPRGGLAATATDDGLLVAVGGEQPGGTFAEVEVFDLLTERWSTLPDLPTPRHGLGVVAVGNTVHVLAGGPEPGYAFSDAHEAIELR